MAATIFMLIGLGLQLFGIGVAARGLWRTWREYAPSDQRLQDDLLQPYRVARDWLVQTFNRLFRRRIHGRAAAVSAHATATASGHVSTEVLHPPVPNTWKSARPVIVQRLDQMRKDVDGLRNVLAQVDSKASELDKRLTKTAELAKERDTKVAIGGIPLAVHGLIYVGVGIGVQILGELVR